MEARTRFLLPGGHRWLRAHVMGVQLLAQLLVLLLGLLALLALVVLAPRVGYAQASTWVEVERRVSLTDGRTASEMKAIAVQEALAEAVRRVAGVRVQGTQSATSGDSAGTRIDRFEQAVRLDLSGRATRWEIVREEWQSAKNSVGAPPVLVLTLRVQVTPEIGQSDAGFGVTLGARTTRLIVRGETPAANDEIIATVRSTTEAYITLVSIAGDSVFVLTPNVVTPSVVAGPSGTIEIPDAETRRLGLHLRVTLPTGVTVRGERLLAVATRTRVTAPGGAGTGEARDTGVLT
ncbi:MAG: hypothetical protein EBS65_24880, partial [Betaproteobacteria bacterium]|nr:hypothetical protein [Betaproteobacteria bacterium]